MQRTRRRIIRAQTQLCGYFHHLLGSILMKVFNSKALLEWLRDTGKRNGWVNKVLRMVDGRNPRIRLVCERSGSYRRCMRKNNEGHKQKRPNVSGTKKCDCPFALRGIKLSIDDDWMVKVLCGVHNLPASRHLLCHSYAGRLSGSETNILADMSKNNVSPEEILNILKQRDVHNATTLKHIYNARHKYKIAEQVGHFQMEQQLMNKLREHNYIGASFCS